MGPRFLARFAAFVATLVAATASSSPASRAAGDTRPGFVGRVGTSFMLNEAPFRVAGVNNHYLAFGSQAETVAVLDDAQAMSANVVRTFVQPVIGSPDGSVATIWNWKSTGDSGDMGAKGRYVLSFDPATQRMAFNDGDDGLRRLDFVVAEAGKRNLKLILSLLDFWGYGGGAQQISAWYGSADKYTFFAADARTRQDYKDWVRHVLTHVNSLTGVAYKDDPTIMAWDLMNEPDIHPISLMVDWVAEMSVYVKSIDPVHLVASGRASMREPFAELDIPTVDFATWHGYPSYEHMSHEAFNALIAKNCAIAKEYHKPMLLEEFGVPRADPDQANAYRNWLNTIAERSSTCAGWVVWRLVSKQDSGQYSADEHDGFDIHNDGSATWLALRAGAQQLLTPGTATQKVHP